MSRRTDKFNPFPGLRPFNQDEDFLFFGREQQISDLLTLLRKNRFIAVVGASGSGKSSVVRAGLLPEVLGGGIAQAGSAWEIALMRPGGNPFRNLAKSLIAYDIYFDDDDNTLPHLTATLTRSSLGLIEAVKQSDLESDVNLLLVVDQFEELFRFHQSKVENEDEAAAFVHLLLEACQQTERPIYVVLTMRSDFLGDCAQFAGLAEAINHGEYLIPRLNREQLRSAIEGPVGVGGAKMTPQLVQELLNDVGRDQDQLPVLQHALMRTWEFWAKDQNTDSALDLKHYESAGRMERALRQHADEIYWELPSDRLRSVAEDLFKTITEFGSDNRGIRRPVRLRRLCAICNATEEEVVTVIEAFRKQGRTFLMPMESVDLTSETVIDLSHESLMRVWTQLSEWVDEEAASSQIYRRLADTAALHHNGKAGLYRDPDLQIAVDWRDSMKPTAEWAQRYHPEFDEAMQFLSDSLDAAKEEDEARIAAQKRELEQARQLAESKSALASEAERSASRLRSLAIAMALIAFVAIGACIAAVSLKRQADLSKQDALQKEKIAIMAAKTATDAADDAEAARKDAELQSARADEEARNAKTALDEIKRRNRARYFHQITLAKWAWQTDDINKAKQFLSECPNELRNLEWGYLNRLCQLKSDIVLQEDSNILCMAYKGDGRFVAVGCEDGRVLLKDIQNNQTAVLGTHPTPITAIAYSGRRILVAATADGKIKFWNDLTNKEIRTIEAHDGRINRLVFDRDDKMLASCGDDQMVKVWRVFTGLAMNSLSGHANRVTAIAFQPLTNNLVSASESGIIKVWDLESGQETAELLGHQGGVNDLTFGKEVNALISAGDDRTVRIWDLKQNDERFSWRSHTGSVHAVAITGDSRRIATAGDDQTVRIFNAITAEELRAIKRHDEPILDLQYSNDGRWLATLGNDRTVRITQQHQIPIAAHNYGARGVAFSPDGSVLVSVANDAQLKFWNANNRQRLNPTFGILNLFPNKTRHRTSIYGVAFSPNGKHVATCSQDHSVIVWNAKTQQPIKRIVCHNEAIWCVAFSPDGETLATCSNDRKIRLWQISSGKQMIEMTGHANPVLQVAFHPLGKRLASASSDGTMRIWDVASGKEITTQEDHQGAVNSVAYSRDGNFLASASDDRTVKIRDASTGNVIRTLFGHLQPVTRVVFSPAGDRLASGGQDSSVRIWETSTGQVVHALTGQLGQVNDLAFDPGGTRLASACSDGTVMLWDAWLPNHIVASGQKWKWLHPTDGVDPMENDPDFHTTFFEPDYDDSHWNEDLDSPGPDRGFGYREVGFQGVSIGTPEPNHRKTAYFRHRFSTKSLFGNLILNMRRDAQLEDGVIVYLDGAEVFSDNILQEDPESYDMLSRRSTQSRFQVGVVSAEIPGVIEPGEHVIAISLHNNKDNDPTMQIGEISLEGRVLDKDEVASQIAIYRPKQPRSIDCKPGDSAFRLMASEFQSNHDKTNHQNSQWQVWPTGEPGNSIVNVISSEHLSEYALPESMLWPATSYSWRVAYRSSNNMLSRFSQTFTFVTPGKQLIAAGSSWKYLHPADGVDPATTDDDFHSTFADVDYDDSTWQVGQDSIGPQGGFGYGDLANVEWKAPGPNNRKSAYFRHAFATENTFQGLILRLQRDDGIIAYIDGSEVLRDNVQNGPDAYDLYSLNTTSGMNETQVRTYKLETILPPGKHVLAISLHNRFGGSSDLRLAEISLVGVEKVEAETTEESE